MVGAQKGRTPTPADPLGLPIGECPSPIAELQQHVLDQEVPVSTLLRYALLIATRLKDVGMVEWCTSELNGYKAQPKVDYRTAYGEYMATDEWGRDLPVMVKDPKYWT